MTPENRERAASELFSHASALAGAGRSGEAIEAYRRLIGAEPGLAQAHNNLGTLLASLGREAEAIPYFERAIELQPGVASTHGNLGVALYVTGRLTEARHQFARQTALEPRNAHARGLLGVVTLELGDVNEALQLFERAIEDAPNSAWLYLRWADATTVRRNDARIAAMEALLATAPGLSAADRSQLGFALGKAYDDIGDYDAAFAHYEKANRLQRQEVAYDEPSELRKLEDVATAYDAGTMRELAGRGDPSGVPIFIVGMPRSGTTLVEQLLAAHPDVHAAGETNAFELALQEFGAHHLRSLGRSYVERVTADAPHALRVTDKFLPNFAHAGAIALALPNARIVSVRRDPVDTCLSCYFQAFMKAQPFSYDLAELGRYYRAYERLMQHWREVLPAGATIEVRYEDLVADFERVARSIVERCGLEWSDACLAFHASQRPVRTASAAQVRRPLYASAVNRSANYRKHLGPLLEALR